MVLQEDQSVHKCIQIPQEYNQLHVTLRHAN